MAARRLKKLCVDAIRYRSCRPTSRARAAGMRAPSTIEEVRCRIRQSQIAEGSMNEHPMGPVAVQDTEPAPDTSRKKTVLLPGRGLARSTELRRAAVWLLLLAVGAGLLAISYLELAFGGLRPSEDPSHTFRYAALLLQTAGVAVLGFTAVAAAYIVGLASRVWRAEQPGAASAARGSGFLTGGRARLLAALAFGVAFLLLAAGVAFVAVAFRIAAALPVPSGV
jgi:hypothetical protein